MMAVPLWRALFALIVVLVAVVFWSTLVALHNRWSEVSHSYSHGYLLLAVAGYLIWQSRARLGEGWRPTAWLAIPLLLGASFFWFAGFATQLTLAQQVALPALGWLLLVVALGWRAGWWLLLPAVMIYFGVPVWDFLVEPLQRVTVAVTQSVLSMLAIPAHVRGFYIEVPTGSFEVAGGCSGLNYLLVALVIGILHGHLNLSGWRRAAGVVLAVGLALLSNWIRVLALVLIGYHTRMESELIEDHDGFGWFVFAGALVVYFLLSRWLLERDAKVPVAVAVAPGRPIDWPVATGRLAIAAVAAVSLPLWAQWFDARLADGPKPGVRLPSAVSATTAEPSWVPAYQGFDTQQAWLTMLAGQPAEMVVQTWHTQAQDRKLIYYANRLAPERAVVKEAEPITAEDVRMNRTVIRNGVERRLVWWFYLVGDRTATGGLETKIKQLPAWLVGDPRAALVAISMRCRSTDCRTELEDTQLEMAVGELVGSAMTEWRSEPAG